MAVGLMVVLPYCDACPRGKSSWGTPFAGGTFSGRVYEGLTSLHNSTKDGRSTSLKRSMRPTTSTKLSVNLYFNRWTPAEMSFSPSYSFDFWLNPVTSSIAAS